VQCPPLQGNLSPRAPRGIRRFPGNVLRLRTSLSCDRCARTGHNRCNDLRPCNDLRFVLYLYSILSLLTAANDRSLG
jgi:hypothetical protein